MIPSPFLWNDGTPSIFCTKQALASQNQSKAASEANRARNAGLPQAPKKKRKSRAKLK